MTECHRLRQVMSHSPSFDFPEPGSWWTACLWECPPQTLKGGRRAFLKKIYYYHYFRKFPTASYSTRELCLLTSIIFITNLYRISWTHFIIWFLEVLSFTSRHKVHNDFITLQSKLLWTWWNFLFKMCASVCVCWGRWFRKKKMSQAFQSKVGLSYNKSSLICTKQCWLHYMQAAIIKATSKQKDKRLILTHFAFKPSSKQMPFRTNIIQTHLNKIKVTHCPFWLQLNMTWHSKWII